MVIYEGHRSVKGEYLYNQVDKNLNFQKHTHCNYEIVFCLGGCLVCEVGNTKYELHNGEGMLILPGYIHSYSTPEESEDYLCVFSTDLVSLFYEKTKMKSFSNTRFSFDGRDDIDILTDESRSIFAKQAVLYRLCAAVFEQSEIEKIDESYFALTNSLSMYIQNNFTKKLKLQDIAKEFGYDYSYLSSFFNRNFDMDFASFINKYRIQFACELLKNSDEDVTQIAMKCGFSTIRNFNRVFKNETGQTPKDYRSANSSNYGSDSKRRKAD